MKKTMMTVLCLSMIFLLGTVVFENSYAANADQEVVLPQTPANDTTKLIETSNTVTKQVCPYNHENCDGIHKNENCPNNHENCNGNCQYQQNIQNDQTISNQACPNNHDNCNGNCQNKQNSQCDNTKKHKNSSTKGQHRNSN